MSEGILKRARDPVLVLFGPTASGKTGILQRLFNKNEGGASAEIVSADSMQVYRGMNIGTAKPSRAEMEKLPHHLIDIRTPNEQFNAGDFVRLASEACADIASRGKLPVVSGGTGFYLKNFMHGLPEAPPSDTGIREQLWQEASEKGAATLMEELAKGDPVSAGRIHINDEYRLVRALEVLRLTGKPLSSFRITGEIANSDFRFLTIGLKRPREELYQRINLRCQQMFQAGLASEVEGLFAAGYTPNDPGLRAIGYREFFVEDFEADSPKKYRLSKDLAGVEALVAQNSRHYAKRQMTFFTPLPGVTWLEAGDEAETARQIKLQLETFLGEGA